MVMFDEINWYFRTSKANKIPLWKVLLVLPAKVIKRCFVVLVRIPRRIYRSISKNSIFFQKGELDMCSLYPQKKLDKVLELFNPKSVLDLGCGVGRSLDYFKSKGVRVVGVEGSKLAISKAKNKDLVKQFDLANEVDLEEKFDLVWSFEFVEHIHPRYVDNLLKTFSRHSDNIVISAARPGQGGEGHFNEQSPEYWVEKFNEFGYRLNKEKTDELRKIDEVFSSNMLVFER